MSSSATRIPGPEQGQRIHAVADDALGCLDAVAVAQAIRDRSISAREAVDAAIARLEQVEPVLNATVCHRFDAARGEAEQAPAHGPLAGVPSLIKDNTDLRGMPTLHGSKAVPANPALQDGIFARQFCSTGLIPLAKTTLPEFGLTATTESSHREATRNPWHTGHSTGGSSGGSAALVAAGVVPIAHANDGGGSIRIPAACCGVVGMKPSRNRLHNPEMSRSLPIQIVAEGVVSRSVRDTATFLAAAEQHWRNPKLPAIGKVTKPGERRLKIALWNRLSDGSPSHPDTVAAVESAALTCENLGHRIEVLSELPFDSEQFAADFLLYWAMLAASLVHFGKQVVAPGFDSEALEPLTHHLAAHFRRNVWRLPMALRRLQRFSKTAGAMMRDYDIILTPTLAHPPPAIGHLALELPPDEAFARLQAYASFTPLQNVSGTPAISLPLGRSEAGLPIGIQFAAGMGEEALLLALALELEQAVPWPQIWSG